MPRVHKQKANKDYPEHGIKKGDTYYKWKFRYGGTRKSLTRPRPSQLTQSRWGDILAALEAIEDAETVDDVRDAIEEAVSTIEGCQEEYAEAAEPFYNQGPNQERADHLEELQQELQSVDLDGEAPCGVCSDETPGRRLCPECLGIGSSDECDNCGSSGQVWHEHHCEACDGTGLDPDGGLDDEDEPLKCSTCWGERDIAEDCPKCKGEGLLTCEKCEGDGGIDCATCEGAGTLDSDHEDANEAGKVMEIKEAIGDLDWYNPA